MWLSKALISVIAWFEGHCNACWSTVRQHNAAWNAVMPPHISTKGSWLNSNTGVHKCSQAIKKCCQWVCADAHSWGGMGLWTACSSAWWQLGTWLCIMHISTCSALQGSAWCFAVTQMHTSTHVNVSEHTLSGEKFPSCNAKMSSNWWYIDFCSSCSASYFPAITITIWLCRVSFTLQGNTAVCRRCHSLQTFYQGASNWACNIAVVSFFHQATALFDGGQSGSWCRKATSSCCKHMLYWGRVQQNACPKRKYNQESVLYMQHGTRSHSQLALAWYSS